MATKNLKITIKVPTGIKATNPLVVKATKAAQSVINESGELIALQQELAAKGLNFTIAELEAKRGGAKTSTKKPAGKKVTKKGAKPGRKAKGKRKVLTADEKKALVADLKAGATATAAAAKHGVSTATVNNIKRDAGLTKSRGK